MILAYVNQVLEVVHRIEYMRDSHDARMNGLDKKSQACCRLGRTEVAVDVGEVTRVSGRRKERSSRSARSATVLVVVLVEFSSKSGSWRRHASVSEIACNRLLKLCA